MPSPGGAQIAKAALRRLAAERLEPTPENYARAYRLEAGAPAASVLPARAQRLIESLAARAFDTDSGHAARELSEAMAQGHWEQAERALEAAPAAAAEALAELIERIVRGIERGGHHWTAARRKEGIQRVLSSSRSDTRRLQLRLSNLVSSWDGDGAANALPVEAAGSAELHTDSADPAQRAADAAVPPAAVVLAARATAAVGFAETIVPIGTAAPIASLDQQPWARVIGTLAATLRQALPAADAAVPPLADALEGLTQRLAAEGASIASADELQRLCDDAGRVLRRRDQLFDQLGTLCRELTASLTELAENDGWVRGQCDAMRLQLEDALTPRGLRAVAEMLHSTRARHHELRAEREQARAALKLLINRMLSELGELGSKTGHFHASVGRYAAVIEQADSLESLTGVVREMVEESRTVQSLVQQTQQRLQQEHAKASALSERVSQLESEMRRLSDEVSTDQLTQVANRRGLMQAFEVERARLLRGGGSLSVGLLDIDNFKRLNDELGHGAGDIALKSLAEAVGRALRPTDHVARYGGEEFVVLLPDTPAAEGERILTRLQRSLTGGLFLHQQKQVFVTFSAGVTAYRPEERIEDALERADQALYEAKRLGKNRTCTG